MVNVENLVPARSYTPGKLWFLSRDQPFIKTTCFQQRSSAHKYIAATEFGEPWLIHPIEVENAIED